MDPKAVLGGSPNTKETEHEEDSPWPAARCSSHPIGTPNPRKHFDTPQALLEDPGLADTDKVALLTEWDSEMDAQLSAESEGMSASDPISAKREGRLAEEAKMAKIALTKIVGKPD